MKKILLLLASAALLLVGCTKDLQGLNGGDSTLMNFSVQVESAKSSRAIADTDGAAANVNRCIMEMYYGDELYKRLEQRVANGMASFSNVSVVAGKQYQILFWADYVTDTTTTSGLATDKYYTTTSLKSVTVKTANFLGALEAGENDKLDAFFHSENYTVPQAGGSYAAKLTRPFAQINVITTDVGKGNTVSAENLLPDSISVSYKAANVFNVATGKASGTETFAYKAPVYGKWETVTDANKELTLSMDYILTTDDKKAMVDVSFQTKNGGNVVMTHNLTNLPYQRNYRTNVKGQLLTAQGKWTATIENSWLTPEYDVPYYVASSIVDARSYIETSSDEEKIKAVDLSNVVPTVNDFDQDSEDKTIKFELKKGSPEDQVNFTLPAIPQEVLTAGCTGWKITYEEGYPTKNVNVTAPQGTTVTIEAPDSHVTLNGIEYQQVTATTSQNTLVVPAGVTVNKLIVKRGAVEIHGTVNELEVTPDEVDTVVFRACEGLSAKVFAKIYDGNSIDYIDPWYTFKQDGETYDIYKLPVVAMIGKNEYKSIADAVDAVPADNEELVTIKVMDDVVLKKAEALTINKNNVVIDGNNHTITLDEEDSELTSYLVDGSSKKYGSFQMIKVSGNDVTLKNLTLDSKNYRGASLATTYGGKNVSYENIVYKGLGSGHYYGYAGGDGTLKFKNCTFETHGYAIHTAECQSVLEVSDCEIHGWVSFGNKTKSATFTNTHFYSTTDQYNGVIATIRPYCATTITNCTFSKEYLTKYKYDGLTVRSNVVVSLKGCSVEDGELCDIANFDGDDPWENGGVIAIDASGNATVGFKTGTFVAKQAEDIKVAQGFKIVAVEGKTNVWTTAPVEYKTTLLRGSEVFGKYETIADAVWAFNYDPEITAGDYTLNIKPGTYNEDMILFIQDKTEGKYRTLLVQSADSTQKVVVKSTSAMKAVFGIAAESDYSGGPISFKNIDIDVTENTNSEAYPVYFAGSQSGTPDLIFPEPSTSYNRRYAHNVSFDNCNIIGNGTSQAFVTSTGTGGIKVENCEITDCVMGFNGYMVALHANLPYGLHVKNVRFDGGTFINNQSAGASEVSVEDCTIKCNRDYAIRTSGSSQVLDKFEYQFVIKNTTIEVDGAYMEDSRGVIYFRSSETHALIDNNCTVTKKNLTRKDDTCILYDIYNKNTTVTINGKDLPLGSLVNMEWLTEN